MDAGTMYANAKALHELLQEARAENDKLVMKLNAEHIVRQNVERENAKLRELVRDMYCLAYPTTVEWEVADETYDKYSPCERCNELHGGKSPCASTSKDMTEECCAPIQASVVADRMRELGVDA